MNKRRLILVAILLITCIFLGTKHWKNSQESPDEQSHKNTDYHLDNGIQFGRMIEKKQFMKDIYIGNIAINDHKITYTVKNNSKSDIYISNQVMIGDGNTTVSTDDSIDNKIILQSNTETSLLILSVTQQELSVLLDNQLTQDNIQIMKPVYKELYSAEVIGIAKSQ